MTAYAEIPAPSAPDYTLSYANGGWQAIDNSGVAHFADPDFATVFNQASSALTAYGLAFTHNISGATCYYAFPPAPTLATSSGGSVDAGDHYYGVSAVSATGESIVGFERPITITSNHSVVLTNIPTGPAGTTARKIYRTSSTTVISGGTFSPGPLITDGRLPDLPEFYLVTTINDNTSTTYTDMASDASIVGAAGAATNFAPNTSDGGCITMARPPTSVSVSGVLRAVAVTQSLQMYAQQTFLGLGRAWNLLCTTAVSQQYGVLNASIGSTDTTFIVNESIAPPPVPFNIGVKISVDATENMVVTNRSLVSGSQYTYTVIRGCGVPAQAITAGGNTGKVMGCAQGRATLGATFDMYHADRTRLEGVVVTGQNNSMVGAVHCRTAGVNKLLPANGTGINMTTSYIMYCDFQGALGPEVSVGAPLDQGATSDMWVIFNRINGKNGTGLVVNIGDGFVRFNNVCGGTPPCINNASSITWEGNHIANSGAQYGDIYILSGQQMHFFGNYMDSVGNGGVGGGGAFMRPPGLASLNQNIQFNGNRYSCSTVTDGLTNIFNFQSPSNKLLINGEYFHGGNAAVLNLFYNNGGTGWQISNCQTAFTPATVFGGTQPGLVGANGINNKYTQNLLSLSTTGNGSATTFTLAHQLTSTPRVVTTTANSQAAAATHWWTADATNITINFAVAPSNAASLIMSVFCSL